MGQMSLPPVWMDQEELEWERKRPQREWFREWGETLRQVNRERQQRPRTWRDDEREFRRRRDRRADRRVTLPVVRALEDYKDG